MLSIITVVFNDKNGLIKTIESVREQKKYFSNFEYINAAAVNKIIEAKSNNTKSMNPNLIK